MKICINYSGGDASAVAAKIAITKYAANHDLIVVRIRVSDEHPDGDRHARDCAKWFGLPVVELESDLYPSAEAVWEAKRYMSGVHGAPCTEAMKKAVRRRFEADWRPDIHILGFTDEERDRSARFRSENSHVGLVCPLQDEHLSKSDCHAIVRAAGIELHAMYRLGFPNANCIGCVKNQSPNGWNLVRRHFPDVFDRRAKLSRELGCRLVKLTTGDRERIYLDELPNDYHDPDPIPDIECSLMCYGAQDLIQ
jgi:3'-phosphoadenosine 5'-phosphosulfate sulfotransferase (PAPS reductase)/FAD synthetase